MNTDFGKILVQIYDSSVADHWETMVVWQQFIILAAPTGMVDMTKESISRRTGIPLKMIEAAIAELEAPDPKSRSKNEQGRRLIRLDPERDWGWSLVNYLAYRDNTQKNDRKDYMKNYMRERRAKEGLASPVSSEPAADDPGELLSEEDALAGVMADGIPEKFSRLVYADWVGNGGKNSKNVPVEIVAWIRKRWRYEQVDWKNGKHQANRVDGTGATRVWPPPNAWMPT